MSESKEVKHYQVSGLDYTMPRLLCAMGTVLVGYLAVSVCLGVVGSLVPLQLKELGTSSTLMVFIMSTLGQILNMTVCPWVSFKSDRYRSKRWGRRVPFILYTLPPICLSWLMVGFYELEAKWLGMLLPKLSTATLCIIVLAIGVVIYKFFYMFVGSVFYYIYYDVIPPQFLTRFTGALQITGSIGGALFNFFIFKHAMTHFRGIFVGVAIFYAILMGFMCFALKEPQFPEPDEKEKKKGQGLQGLGSFMKESFTHKIYWYEYIQTSCTGAASAATMFFVFHNQAMGLSLEDIGNIGGIGGICATIATFVVAGIGSSYVDKWHPVRTSVFLTPFVGLLYLYNCKWFLFLPPVRVYWWMSLLLVQVLFFARFTGIAGMPFLMKTLPKSRFGQFCSARSLVSSLIGMLFALLFGVFMDFLKIRLNLGEQAYRASYIWYTFFFGLGVIFRILMFREYKKLGGYDEFKAPAVWEKSGYETMDVSKAENPHPRYLRWMLWAMDGTFALSAISMIVLGIHAEKIGAPGEAKMFFGLALPVSIGVLVFWMAIHKWLNVRIRKYESGLAMGLPHHGLMLLIMLARLLCVGVFGMQAWLAMGQGSGHLSAAITVVDLAVDFLIIGLIWLYASLEIPCKMETSGGEAVQGA